MKYRMSILIILTLIVLTGACRTDGIMKPTATPMTPGPTAVVDPGFNLLVVADGEVQLKREAWSNFHSTAFGAVLHRGDQLNAIGFCQHRTLGALYFSDRAIAVDGDDQ